MFASKKVVKQKTEAKTGNNNEVALFRIIYSSPKYQIQRISQHQTYSHSDKERSIIHVF